MHSKVPEKKIPRTLNKTEQVLLTTSQTTPLPLQQTAQSSMLATRNPNFISQRIRLAGSRTRYCPSDQCARGDPARLVWIIFNARFPLNVIPPFRAIYPAELVELAIFNSLVQRAITHTGRPVTFTASRGWTCRVPAQCILSPFQKLQLHANGSVQLRVYTLACPSYRGGPVSSYAFRSR